MDFTDQLTNMLAATSLQLRMLADDYMYDNGPTSNPYDDQQICDLQTLECALEDCLGLYRRS